MLAQLSHPGSFQSRLFKSNEVSQENGHFMRENSPGKLALDPGCTLMHHPSFCLMRAELSFLKWIAQTINKAPGVALGIWRVLQLVGTSVSSVTIMCGDRIKRHCHHPLTECHPLLHLFFPAHTLPLSLWLINLILLYMPQPEFWDLVKTMCLGSYILWQS